MVRLRGITLFEVLVVIGIVMLFARLAATALVPTVHEGKARTACSSNLRQIVAAERMYAADHDGELPLGTWYDASMAPYLSAEPQNLYCPKAHRVFGHLWNPYLDLNEVRRDSVTRKTALPLPFSLKAPAFDSERDALVKCEFHGSGAFEDPSFAALVLTGKTARFKVLTGYLDGHVGFGYFVPCWELPYFMRLNMYKREPRLVYACDGTLEKS